MANSKSYWLLKTEPETYSFGQLLKEKRTHWNGVRNFQARKFLMQMKVGDLVLIYHSVSDKAIVGVAKIVKEAYPDPDPTHAGDWVQVDLEAVKSLDRMISLAELKADGRFKDLLLIKQSRLSSMPLSKEHFDDLMKLSSKK